MIDMQQLIDAAKYTLQEWREHGFHESRGDFDECARRLAKALDDVSLLGGQIKPIEE